MNRTFAIFLHRGSGEGMDDRFDTLLMPNGGIAACSHIAHELGVPSVAIDDSWPNPQMALATVYQTVEESLSRGQTPVILASLLSYNAQPTLETLSQLKETFGSRVRVGVGGQLVRVTPHTYERLRYLDHICVGDAECTLPLALTGERIVNGFVSRGDRTYGQPGYAPMRWNEYTGIADRLDTMSQVSLGPLTGIRQLLVESRRGCAWAYESKQACSFCALQDVSIRPDPGIEASLHSEQKNAEQFGANWSFDVSNQWLPTLRPNGMREWLNRYIQSRNRLGVTTQKYVYLTANSFTSETGPLLRQAGVRIAYVGFDGWTKETRNDHHKSQALPERVLQICRENDILVRASFVIGGGARPDDETRLRECVTDLITRYGTTILSLGAFVEIILPGSEIWHRFRESVRSESHEAARVFEHFETHGWMSWEQSRTLMRHWLSCSGRSHLTIEQADNMARETTELVEQHLPHAFGITIERGGRRLS